MGNKLNKLIENLRGLGYKDYLLSTHKGNILIKFPNIKEMTISEKTKIIKEFGVTVDVTDTEYTIVY